VALIIVFAVAYTYLTTSPKTSLLYGLDVSPADFARAARQAANTYDMIN
jgi:hypothetical protein